jgi:hypothetical protein
MAHNRSVLKERRIHQTVLRRGRDLRWAYGGSAGSVLRALRKLWGGSAFALCARGFGDRFQGLLRTDPAPLGVLGGSAGSVLRALRKLGGGSGFRAVREGLW